MANDVKKLQDGDPQETREWLEALASVLDREGTGRAHFLIEQLIDQARRSGAYLPYSPNTAYVNTIPVNQEPQYPGDRAIEKRIEAYIRWNAMAMVVHANKENSGIGGHIATYASAGTLYEVGFNHFWRAPSKDHGGDLVYIQGHSSPGIYARSFLEGRFSNEQLLNFRREVERDGLSSYPHPWLMHDYWQFPTVSMGLGPLQAIYQARFMRYLEHRGFLPESDRKVWAMLGDGEMDEPESTGAISLASREKLDNLIFVVNCNLQRLDGPVRGNGKIIQELEAVFRGSGWNVIKVLWGGRWDQLFMRDKHGLLPKLMMECVDGEYQNYKSKDGKYVREKFFGKYPELLELVANMSDEEVWNLNRGGHDARKVYAAYKAAVDNKGQPTVILAMTVKGFGMGKGGQGAMGAHQQKKLDENALKEFRDRFNIPVSDDDIANTPFERPGEDSKEIKYLKAQRAALGGYLPQRRTKAEPLNVPDVDIFKNLLDGTGDHPISSTMALVRMITALVKDKNIGKHVVPIVPDEARTFGMEGLFRQIGIYSSVGQLYEPADAEQLMFYKESKTGQILEEGITEEGSMASWIAAATAYSTHGVQMIPFYIYYSMFGYQRAGDLFWAAGDIQARGFLVGGTAGRTTLEGEGLQHDDGHNHVMVSNIPNCVAYDPTYAYELAVILADGMRRMFKEQENVFYYLTVMNENYLHPAMPKGAEQGILKGMYLLRAGGQGKLRVQLMGSGTILREVEAAADLLQKDWNITADVWSATSFTELRREGQDCARWNLYHPDQEPRVPYVTQQLEKHAGPVITASDYVKLFADQIREFVPRRFVVLGTDGFGRSDTREGLRHYFEVDRRYVTVAALKALADEGQLDVKKVNEAIKKYGIDPKKPNPVTV
ncbi:MAG TPA: pyruvate dehydrogenase (acetyl-transferring), homodimeric type [Gammaproteobacteria bacterium]|nr:pyruvate dehydrogenase (acetyl-transferring), homodimeric type [Gammaproteobacteria bacterium]